MDIATISGLQSPLNIQNQTAGAIKKTDNNSGFEALFESALSMLKETNGLTKAVEEEEMKYAMGITDNLHDLMGAQSKANISVQYTVAVRNTVMDAYKEIMNLQF